MRIQAWFFAANYFLLGPENMISLIHRVGQMA